MTKKQSTTAVSPNELIAQHQKDHKRLTPLKIAARILFITLGAILMAVALEIFLIPNKVMDGGIVGISIILSELTGFKLGMFLFVLNLPFFYLGYKQIGKTFAYSTVYGITVLSFTTAYLHHVSAFTEDLLLATFFGGLVLGMGVGIVIRYGGALDGTEILSILITKKLPFSVGEIVLFFNAFIFGWGGFVFGWDRAMYSILAYVVAAKTMDTVIQGMDEQKSAWIISDKSREIGAAISARLGRGATYLRGEGAYSGGEKEVIFCVITRLEEAKLKDIVDGIDENAFLAIADISEVHGGRFKKRDIH